MTDKQKIELSFAIKVLEAVERKQVVADIKQQVQRGIKLLKEIE